MFKIKLSQKQRQDLIDQGFSELKVEAFEDLLNDLVKKNNPWLYWICLCIIGLITSFIIGILIL